MKERRTRALYTILYGFIKSVFGTFLHPLNSFGDRDTLIPLRLWICSGETLPTTLAVMFFNWFKGQKKILANFYGSTEVMGDVSYYFVEEYDHMLEGSSIPIGEYPI
ncbi:hypothetical protein QAD02_008180 [Eretmocerus hayati]|uniref:Uncharacterized protein n=1 Tax=Eretmocerus hayati TaxID=131215 RepID=A0ACC2N5S9_9HYME|nr:hypothetical protein QAD02_008180 [Eretmocerus hayati]